MERPLPEASCKPQPCFRDEMSEAGLRQEQVSREALGVVERGTFQVAWVRKLHRPEKREVRFSWLLVASERGPEESCRCLRLQPPWRPGEVESACHVTRRH